MSRKKARQSRDLPVPKYPKPKILLMDINDQTETALRTEGYTISIGSFGVPYRVEKGNGLLPVIMNATLPRDYTEQEIIVVDLKPGELVDPPEREKHTTPRQSDWWASCSRGVIDPRPRAMASVREAFDRILSHGGVFIIFADQRELCKQVLGYVELRRFVKAEEIPYDNWCFLTVLGSGWLEVKPDYGEEMSVPTRGYLLGRQLSEHARGASFLCTLDPLGHGRGEYWFPLALNKYGAQVAAMKIVKSEGAESGLVFILPRLRDRPRFLSRFLKEVLPDFSPHLFPHIEGARWVHRPEYKLPRILELEGRIQQVQEEARCQIAELEKAIKDEQAEIDHLYGLLTQTGARLVSAVKKTLEVLGFQTVIDIDEEMKKTGDTGPKREDLQVRDGSPILLVEVKGISGLPSDEDALQAWKYVAPRMKEWKRTDVQGLSIINHQRHLPALDRDNVEPFREDIVVNAREQGFGLLTTWDLHRLARSFIRNQWRSEHVKALFYKVGRIAPVPENYEFVGVVERFAERLEVVGIQLETGELRVKDHIAFELSAEFIEQSVESIQIDRKPVTQAPTDTLVGVKTRLSKEQARKGVRVFRVT